jgi:hypothetical protein
MANSVGDSWEDQNGEGKGVGIKTPLQSQEPGHERGHDLSRHLLSLSMLLQGSGTYGKYLQSHQQGDCPESISAGLREKPTSPKGVNTFWRRHLLLTCSSKCKYREGT